MWKALLVFSFCFSLTARDEKWTFFAMDTGTKDSRIQSIADQVQLVKQIGFDGIGWTPPNTSEALKISKTNGVQVVTLYLGVDVSQPRKAREIVEASLVDVRGNATILWLYVTYTGLKPSDEKGDEAAAALLREMSDLASRHNVRIALYPHTGFWLERIQDATRLASKVNRSNMGVTFNLCHALMVGDKAKIPVLLEEARPHLFVVTINGADDSGRSWDRLIMPLDSGSYEIASLLRQLDKLGFRGPIGLQHYGVKGDAETNLERSMHAWQKLNSGHSNSAVQEGK